jgi:hypothetical protein
MEVLGLILLRWRSGEGSLHLSFLEIVAGFLKLMELLKVPFAREQDLDVA